MLAFAFGLGMMSLLAVLVSWLMMAICAGVVAANKGRSGIGWFLIGLLFGPAGLILALVARNLDPEPIPVYVVRYNEDGTYSPDPNVRHVRILSDEGEYKVCPYCAEYIKAQAIVCRYCGRDLDNPPPQGETAQPAGTGSDSAPPPDAPAASAAVHLAQGAGSAVATAPAATVSGSASSGDGSADPVDVPPVRVMKVSDAHLPQKKNTGPFFAIICGICAVIVIIAISVTKMKKDTNDTSGFLPGSSKAVSGDAKDLQSMSEKDKIDLAIEVMSDQYGRPTGDAWEHRSNGDKYEMRLARVETAEYNGQQTLQILAKGNLVSGEKTASGGFVSLFVVVPSGTPGYKVILERTNFMVGKNGQAPNKISRLEVGPGILAWYFEEVEQANGEGVKHHTLLIPHRGTVVKSEFTTARGWELDTDKKRVISATYSFDKKAGGPYYPMIFDVRETIGGKEVRKKTVTVPFDEAGGKYAPPDPVDVIKEAMIEVPEKGTRRRR